jgi:aminomethyltransferase
MSRKTPLFEWHSSHHGKLIDFAGWQMPIHYKAGILQEHLATRKFGGLFDVSHMGRLRVKGPNRLKFLQHVLSNNCEALDPWQAQYTIITSKSGGAIDDAFLYRFGENDYLLVVNAANMEKDLHHLNTELNAFEEVEIEDITPQYALLSFQGPMSHIILESLIQDGLMPDPRQNCLSRIYIDNVEILISRTGYTGEPNSFELFVPSSSAVEIWDTILESGSDQGVLPIGLGARDTLRLEAGMPLYGHELGIDTDGNEIPIYAVPLAPVAVSFSARKGEFIGRAPLLKQQKELHNLRNEIDPRPRELTHRIMSLAIEDKGVPRRGYPVWHNGRQVGVVTSGTMVPYWQFEGEGANTQITNKSFRRSIALAFLEADILPETQLEVEVRRRRLSARVVSQHGRSEAPPYFRALPVGWESPKGDNVAGTGLEKIKTLTQNALTNHRWRRYECINLIPSEQTMSPLVRLLSIGDPVHRYAEHRAVRAVFDQEVFYYQGTDFIAWVEEQLTSEMASFLGCDQVEARAISGQMANMTVFSALISWKNRTDIKTEPKRISLAFNNHIGRGGHLSSQPIGALRDYIAKHPKSERFAVINFPVLADNPYKIDLEATAELLHEHSPELIVLGKSMIIHREPVAQIKRMIQDKKKAPLIMYDMAHVLGLVGPLFQHPFKEGADIVTGSTHKTFYGTQRGIVGCHFEKNTPEWELWEAIQRRAFPGMVSNHHLGTLLGLLAATIEMNTFKADYQAQVIANAKAFASALKINGLDVKGDASIEFTETHQVLIEVGYSKGPEVARRLENNNIICNYQALPHDEGFSASSGLRLGVQEMTRFGMQSADFTELAGLMADVIKYNRMVREEVVKFRERFQEIGYCFHDEEIKIVMAELTSAL